MKVVQLFLEDGYVSGMRLLIEMHVGRKYVTLFYPWDMRLFRVKRGKYTPQPVATTWAMMQRWTREKAATADREGRRYSKNAVAAILADKGPVNE